MTSKFASSGGGGKTGSGSGTGYNKKRSSSSPASSSKSGTPSTNSNNNNSNYKKSKHAHGAHASNNSSSEKKGKYNNKNTNVNNHTTNKNHSQTTAQQQLIHPRKNADIVERGKRLWNLLRCKTNTIEQVRQYMLELLPLVQNKVMELTMQHDASRIVQAAIQFANVSERQAIVQELCATTATSTATTDQKKASSTTGTGTNHNKHTFLDICQSQYAHFVILKVIKYCSKDPVCVNLFINAMKGNILKLITHTNGSRIIEALFTGQNTTTGSTSTTTITASAASILSPKTTAILKQEIYGPHYATFAHDTLQQLVTMVQQQQQQEEKKNTHVTTVIVPTLALNIALLPEKKQNTMEHIKNYIIIKGIDKQLYGYNYFQEILYEYIHVLLNDQSYHEIRSLCSTTNITDHVIHLLSSKVGTRVVCNLIAYSTVKERKRIIKSLKGYCKSALQHKDAYLAIIKLIVCMDDTVALHKNVLQELLLVGNSSTSTSSTSSKVMSISQSKDIIDTKKEGTTNNNEQLHSPLWEIAASDTASKFLLMILTTTTTATTEEPVATASVYSKILNPYEQEILSPFHPYIMEKVTNTTTGTDSNNNESTNGLEKLYTSKKDPEIRRNELLSYFHIPLLQQLVGSNSTTTTATKNVESLLVSISGSNVLYHLYIATIQKCLSASTITSSNSNSSSDKAAPPIKHGTNQNIHQLIQLLKDMIHTICSVCRQNLIMSITATNDSDKAITGTTSGNVGNIFEHVVGHRIIKNLIIYDASLSEVTKNNTIVDDDSNNDYKVSTFTEMFVHEFASDFMAMIQYNRGAFILAALLQQHATSSSATTTTTTVRDRVMQHLHIPTILQEPQQSSNGPEAPKSTAGLHALRQEINKSALTK